MIVTAGGGTVSTVSAGTVIALTATVTANGIPVTRGQVNFCDATSKFCSDIHIVGTAQLTSAGTAAVSLVPGPGARSYKAVFVSTNTYAGSSSPTLTLIVKAATGPVTTTVGVQASGSQGDYALLGTVATNGPASPTGAVSFLDTTNSNYVLATATLGPTGSSGISFLTAYNLLTPRQGTGAGNYIAVADFNGDGIPDLAVSSGSSLQLIVLLGNGDGTFRPAPGNSTINPATVAAGDFNCDGKEDLAVQVYNGIQILLGNGDGTFSSLPVIPSGGTAFVLGDFNGDGVPDIAQSEQEPAPGNTGGNCFRGNENCHIQIYLGNGDGTFAPLGTRTPATLPFTIVSADFNGDGKADLAMSSTVDDYVLVLLGNGDGTFSAAPPLLPNTQSVAIAAADLNGDGHPDLIVTAQNPAITTVLLGHGDGTFATLPDDPAMDQATQAIALGDFNGDAIPDLALPNEDGGYTSVFIGKGDGTFTPDAFSPSVADYIFTSIAVADFNGDGQSDIAEGTVDNRGVDPVQDQLSVLLAQAPNTAAAYVYNISPVGTGNHYVDASYPGDINNSPGISGTVPLLAEQVPTTLTLTASPATTAIGQQVTLSAAVNPFLAQNHYASGNVTFSSSGKTLGTAAVTNGVATLTVTTLAVGTDNLIARYPGDINFTASNSSILPYTVAAGGFTIALSPTTITLHQSQQGTVAILLTSVGNFSGPLALTYGPLPTYATASISPSTVTLTAGGTANSMLTLNTLLKASNQPPARPGSRSLPIALAATLLLLTTTRRKRLSRLLTLLLAAALFQPLTGCVNAFYTVNVVAPGTYQVSVTATDVNHNSQTGSVTVIVTP